MTMMPNTSILIDDHADEVCPSTLDGWAEYLAGWYEADPDTPDAPPEPRARDGEILKATVYDWHYIAATRQPDGIYAVPAPPDGAELHAFCFDNGAGWFPDMIIGQSDTFYRRCFGDGPDPTPAERAADKRAEALRRLAAEGTDPTEWLVCMGAKKPALVRFHLNPPRCEFVDAAPLVQMCVHA